MRIRNKIKDIRLVAKIRLTNNMSEEKQIEDL